MIMFMLLSATVRVHLVHMLNAAQLQVTVNL